MIATIINADVWKIGQSIPDDLTSFRRVGIDEAYQILIDSEEWIEIEDILRGG
jgi:allophanate hydrolase subunit 2